MKNKMFFGGVFFALGFLLAVILIYVPISVRAGVGGVATENGDVNGDGELDIADAVYLLLHMFKGGPAPVACADTPEVLARVQTLEQEVGQLRHDSACSPDHRSIKRFVDSGDGTVFDPCSGLTWAKSVADTNADGVLDLNDKVPWQPAVDYCATLILGGRDDWRLPSFAELDTLPTRTTVGLFTDWALETPFQFLWPRDQNFFWTSSKHDEISSHPDENTGVAYNILFPNTANYLGLTGMFRSWEQPVLAVRGP